MKKISLIILAVLVSALSFAQSPLSGAWTMSVKIFGTRVTENLNFDCNGEGTVVSTLDLDMTLKLFGNYVQSGATYTMKGVYTYEGDKIVMKWDSDSYTAVHKEGGVYTVDGQNDENLKKETIGDLDSLADSFRRDKKGDEVFTKVKISGDKLRYSSVDSNGKDTSGTFSRVK